jgi:N-6 DNA Methylase
MALSRDFRITSAHRIGEGSLREKAIANLAAIRTLKQVEAEDRAATEAEKAVLARYSGWGALSNVFESEPPREWKHTADELHELLTAEEYASARASTPNAHFTSPVVISGIWGALERFGLRAGEQILEPSMGVGHFFGLMPEALTLGTRRTGVELDSVTARIAQRLYPDATIFARGFEDTVLPDNFFDAAIGNIPFGNYPVFDPSYRRTPAVTKAIHDYFFAKSLDKVREGGVVALITSRYTMDKQDSTIRRYLADRANLLGAIRLPNTAFKANAGTEVTTDILFLQKRGRGVEASYENWRDLAPIDTPEGQVLVNEYFARNRDMMLGEMRLEHGMYQSDEPTLVGELTHARLARAVESLPASIYVERHDRAVAQADMAPSEPTALGTVKEGAFAERDGIIVVRNGNRLEPASLPSSVAARVRGMLAVRDAIR